MFLSLCLHCQTSPAQPVIGRDQTRPSSPADSLCEQVRVWCEDLLWHDSHAQRLVHRLGGKCLVVAMVTIQVSHEEMNRAVLVQISQLDLVSKAMSCSTLVPQPSVLSHQASNDSCCWQKLGMPQKGLKQVAKNVRHSALVDPWFTLMFCNNKDCTKG